MRAGAKKRMDIILPKFHFLYTIPMRIFALETDFDKVKDKFLSETEKAELVVHYHPFLFWIRIVRQLLVTIFLVILALGAAYITLPWMVVVIGFLALWCVLALPGVVTAYIDWKYDGMIVTNEKVIIVDQTSIFHVEIKQMYLENFASVNAATQLWNLFPFGMVCFDLKEGVGKKMCLRYVPHAEEVALKLSNCVRCYAHGTDDATVERLPEA